MATPNGMRWVTMGGRKILVNASGAAGGGSSKGGGAAGAKSSKKPDLNTKEGQHEQFKRDVESAKKKGWNEGFTAHGPSQSGLDMVKPSAAKAHFEAKVKAGEMERRGDKYYFKEKPKSARVVAAMADRERRIRDEKSRTERNAWGDAAKGKRQSSR